MSPHRLDSIGMSIVNFPMPICFLRPLIPGPCVCVSYLIFSKTVAHCAHGPQHGIFLLPPVLPAKSLISRSTQTPHASSFTPCHPATTAQAEVPCEGDTMHLALH